MRTMCRVCLILVLFLLLVGQSYAASVSIKVFNVADEGGRYDVLVIPINTPAVSSALLSTDVVDVNMVGFIILVENKTSKPAFLSQKDLIYTNCLREVHRTITPIQVLQSVHRPARIFGLTGDTVARIAAAAPEALNMKRFVSFEFLSSYDLPPNDVMQGLIIFPFSEYEFYTEKAGLESDQMQKTEVHPSVFPIKGSTLHLELVDADGVRTPFDVAFDNPAATIAIDKALETTKPEKMNIKTLPVE